ncbi:hypothetical protein JCM18882A_29770 [Brevibacterium metallidurans]|uniref:Uncharacterized protein n=1 Tax=Brevibacterium metallidurans TaxID=1482676 RepID=A0ABP3CB04_9MICO
MTLYVRPPWVTGTVSLFVPVSHCGPADAEFSDRAEVADRVDRSPEADGSVGSGVAWEAASEGLSA